MNGVRLPVLAEPPQVRVERPCGSTDHADRPWIVAALVSWGIALFEYLLQVPANRLGHEVMNLGQLKILQEVITLSVFVPFAILYMKEKLTLDYLWAAVCLLGAVFFLFRGKLAP